MSVHVVPATADRLDDVVAVLGHGCLCQYWRMSSGDFGRADGTARLAALRSQLGGTPAPGMLAYVDAEPAGSSPGTPRSPGVPVGWCGLGPRRQLERLVRSRTIPAIDDLPVWSIYCFTVRVGYRRRGLSRALLAGAIDYARRQGAPALEAYPVDPAGRRIHGTAVYVGTTGMFERAGFRRVRETDARSGRLPRQLMRLALQPAGPSPGRPG